MDPDRGYTLEEAEAEIAKRDCAISGHDFEIFEVDQSHGPAGIICSRCGLRWAVIDAPFVRACPVCGGVEHWRDCTHIAIPFVPMTAAVQEQLANLWDKAGGARCSPTS